MNSPRSEYHEYKFLTVSIVPYFKFNSQVIFYASIADQYKQQKPHNELQPAKASTIVKTTYQEC